ncbi:MULTISPECIES: GNAT family N-acetyltransferase [unclassified Amedibacterium]|uniref:GNAT family N-acetyltransferase n=1 Tax=unclassified Amedibacterium TaxID=3088137 RepID=UPI000E3F3726|nr:MULTISPECIES: GNAT family N-acetyltransferase [unclassified Absiella]RGB63875.1 GNAT family N-acetyltransferase [Absiella sp. AM09-45]RGB78536.1 GNAT family N-acetyltransferase [Absiella sp. AM09-50]
MNLIIRNIKTEEYPLLKDYLYDAIFIPQGVKPPDKSIINNEDLQVYIKDFGNKKDDICFLAEMDHDIVGAVWIRIMNDYGHIDDQTPSLAISVKKEYRGLGIGTKLMETMLVSVKHHGYQSVSLSVQKANPAVHLYQRLGFQIIKENEEEYLMKYTERRE